MRFRSDHLKRFSQNQAVREFVAALAMLGIALYCSLESQNHVRRGDRTPAVLFATAALLLALITAVTLVPRLARRVNFSRWLIPMSFSITREGGLFILSIFLLSLAAINTGNNLLFMILAALLSAIITSGVFARASLRSVSVSLEVPENVFVGEQVSIKVSLRNRKRVFPSISITVEDLERRGSPGGSGPLGKLARWRLRARQETIAADKSVLRHWAYFPLILPGEVRTELISQSFPRRGRYRLEGFRLSTRFPFGFFRRGEKMRAEGEVLVYPSIQEVSAYFHLLPFQPGHLQGRHMGLGESLYALRKYNEGDSARLVDWKATAKTGELMAREYARDEESKFCLILDTLVHPSTGPDYCARFEKAVSLAASLVVHFLEEGAELEFLTPNEYLPRGMGSSQQFRILRSLAVVEYQVDSDSASADLSGELSGVVDCQLLEEILSEKVFKIIISSKPRGSFPSSIWRSSHVIYFDEL